MTRFLVLALVLLASPVLAADWPQWLGPKRDGISTEIIKPWKGDLKVLWKQPVGPGHSSPVIANGTVYLHTQVPGKEEEALSAFDAVDGKKLWSRSYPRAKFWTLFGTGPQATPAVADGKVFTYGATGILTAFEATKGDTLWQVDTEKEFQVKRLTFGAACSPLIDGKKVIVNVGGKQGSIVAFEINSGKVVWKALDDPASYSSGIRAGDQLVFLTQRGVRGLAPADGKFLWEYRLIDKLDESATTPVVSGEWLMVASITQGMVGLKRQADGTYKEMWSNKEITCYFSTPVPVGDHFYAVTGKLGLGVTSTLHCVETATGKIKWSKQRVGTYHAAMLRTADDKLLFLSDFGDLLLLQPDPKQYKELARTKVTKKDGIWAHPALANGRVYLRDDKELICVEMP